MWKSPKHLFRGNGKNNPPVFSSNSIRFFLEVQKSPYVIQGLFRCIFLPSCLSNIQKTELKFIQININNS